jgi:hypothetical protein
MEKAKYETSYLQYTQLAADLKFTEENQQKIDQRIPWVQLGMR